VREIEAGAQGRVFCARDDDTGACYAVKLFHSNGDRFETERDVLYQLDHPNVIRIAADCVVQLGGTDRGVVVMELGTASLFEVVQKRGPLREQETRTYTRQLLEGLDACHDSGVYHLDIKPENLLLGQDGALRISDFDLASYDIECFEKRGSNGYVCPEMFGTAFPCDASKADVWSAGVTVFTMLMGHQPFKEATSQERLFSLLCRDVARFWAWHLKFRADRLTADCPLSSAAKSFVAQAMCVDPTQRKNAKQLLEHEWFTAVGEV
jgi:serine/threonine protein kinase